MSFVPRLHVEKKYYEILINTTQHKSWLIDYLHNHVYTDKPPFFFLPILFIWHVFHQSIWLARLIPAIFSLFCLLLLLKIEQSWFPRSEHSIDYRGTFYLMTSLFWIAMSTLITLDMLLTFAVLLGIYSLTCAGARASILFLLANCLGFVIKGPVIFLFTLTALFSSQLIRQNYLNRNFIFMLTTALITILITSMLLIPWLLNILNISHTTLSSYISSQIVARISGHFPPNARHVQLHLHPFWYYIPIIFFSLLPWSVMPSIYRSFRNFLNITEQNQKNKIVFLLINIAIPLITFSYFSGKNINYILPIMPYFALLLSSLQQAKLR